ncbi:hypothetical protein DFH06DRAFT_214164 [Mycena polygramma]|nr:hypothetical protein DFH06DRAFT_214164 [Mycena polygramma]
MNPTTSTVYDPRQDPVWSDFRGRVAHDLANKAALLGTPQMLSTPMPSGFPSEWREKIDFQAESFSHFFQYRVKYSPSVQFGPTAWKVYGKIRVPGVAEYLIGYVEVDALVFEDPGPLLARLASNHLILELMSKAVQTDRFIRVAREVYPLINGNNPPLLIGTVERILARSSLQDSPQQNSMLSEVVEVYQEQRVPVRPCVQCGAFLPPVGPNYCLAHGPPTGI